MKQEKEGALTKHVVELTWEDPRLLVEARRRLAGMEFFQRIIDGTLPRAPFPQVVGLRPVAVGPGHASFHLELTDRLDNALGAVHGGAIATLIDMTLIGAAQSCAEVGEAYVTARLQIDYRSPAPLKLGRLHCHGVLGARGERSLEASATVQTPGGAVIATGQGRLVRVPMG